MWVVVRALLIVFKYVKYIINFDGGLLVMTLCSLVGSYRHVIFFFFLEVIPLCFVNNT